MTDTKTTDPLQAYRDDASQAQKLTESLILSMRGGLAPPADGESFAAVLTRHAHSLDQAFCRMLSDADKRHPTISNTLGHFRHDEKQYTIALRAQAQCRGTIGLLLKAGKSDVIRAGREQNSQTN